MALDIRSKFMELSKRDQRAVLAGVVFLVCFCLFKWIISPVFEREKTLSRILARKTAALTEMEDLAQKYARISGSISGNGSLANQTSLTGQRPFSLFSFMDTQAKDSGIKQNIVYMRPFTRKKNGFSQSLDMVDIQLSSVYLSDLAGFLSRIESDPHGVRIQSLSLTRTDHKKGGARLDVLMETAVPVIGKSTGKKNHTIEK